ncbi:ornithine cyclodeaminase family protein [Algicella marina]|uniref:Ornithine cyclodeaminase n=1 Tax=Algicella marina TaxID=2683284 RepID=A0A6P1T7Z6_9RHOB|nr:ornithine cyclodeaminase [Algicella marina]QHQ36712.1 ornithine cyclodeaminase [Algicella marina]
MTPVFLTADMVEPHLDWMRIADALLEGHRRPKADLGDQFLYRGDDTFLSRSAWIDGMGIAVKSVSVLPDNPARKLPSVQGVMVLFDDESGAVEAIIDSALVTKWKTAADSILGARLLARKDSKRLLIVGTGAVAESLVEAYRALYPEIDIHIWGRDTAKAGAMAERLETHLAGSLESGVRGADIISTATMSQKPLIEGAWLKEGQHLDLIGAFTADMREVDNDCLRRAHIFVDSRETTMEHIGELKIPLNEGVITADDVLGDYYDLAADAPGRTGDDEITLLKNGGGAHLDLMTGRALLAAWKEAEAGR